jgi:hypothetical protein
MITRFVPLFLLGASLLAHFPKNLVAQTIELVVPSFDYPGPRITAGQGIGNNGIVVGTYVATGKLNGFYRLPRGRFSDTILVPNSIETTPRGINLAGVVCGTFVLGGTFPSSHGFFFDGHAYTQYDVPGAEDTNITGENDAGDFTGWYDDGSLDHGFINIGGVLTKFDSPGSYTTFPQAINNLGQIAGYDAAYRGFFRDADGTVTSSITYPGAKATYIYGLNDHGLMVGSWEDFGYVTHAFVRSKTGQFISYDYPDDQFPTVVFSGINNSNLISGYIVDPSIGGSHGIIARIGR